MFFEKLFGRSENKKAMVQEQTQEPFRFNRYDAHTFHLGECVRLEWDADNMTEKDRKEFNGIVIKSDPEEVIVKCYDHKTSDFFDQTITLDDYWDSERGGWIIRKLGFPITRSNVW